MITAIAAAAAVLVVLLVLYAYWLLRMRRRVQSDGAERGGDEGSWTRRRSIRERLGVMAGPLPLSLSLHALVFIALLWGVHLEQGRNLITVDLQAGGGGGTAAQDGRRPGQ